MTAVKFTRVNFQELQVTLESTNNQPPSPRTISHKTNCNCWEIPHNLNFELLPTKSIICKPALPPQPWHITLTSALVWAAWQMWAPREIPSEGGPKFCVASRLPSPSSKLLMMENSHSSVLVVVERENVADERRGKPVCRFLMKNLACDKVGETAKFLRDVRKVAQTCINHFMGRTLMNLRDLRGSW